MQRRNECVALYDQEKSSKLILMTKNTHSHIYFLLKTLYLVQLIVSLNKGLINEVDKMGCLPSRHAAQTCPKTGVLEFLISVHPQGLITRSSAGYSPLHLIMMHDFRSGSMKCFFILNIHNV